LLSHEDLIEEFVADALDLTAKLQLHTPRLKARR
jgi:hypothetical protein